MKNKFFFWALWAGAVISANAVFVFFTLAGSDEAAAAWTLSFFALCCVVAVEVMQKRDKPASGCAMWTLRCLGTLLLAFMLRSGGLPLLSGAVFSLAVVMLWFTLIFVIAKLKQGWLRTEAERKDV